MKKLLLFLSICTLTTNLFSQDFDLKWSERMEYDNKKDGFFAYYLNTNEKYIYAIHTNLALSTKKSEKKIKIVAFDKLTMAKANDVALKGFKENAADKNVYKNLDFLRAVVLKNGIYVFWADRTLAKKEKKEVLYCETFSSNLKRIQKLKKIYTANIPEETKVGRYSESIIEIIYNKESSDKIVVGNEIQKKDQDVEFTYNVLNTDLSVENKNTVNLPVEFDAGKSRGSVSYYYLGLDNNLYVKTLVSMDRDERKKAQKGEDISFYVFSTINIESGDLTHITLKDKGKNINDFDFIILDNKVKIYGFFCDLSKDETGNSSHGIFLSENAPGNFEEHEFKYTYFDKKTISSLFSSDVEDKKKTAVFGKKKKEKAKANDAVALDTRFGIEKMISVDENNIVLFCAKMRNYSVTTCTTNSSGGQSCTTRYYCEKSNVTAIKVNNEGEIVWASNIDRRKTYSGTSIYDLNVVFTNNTFYVIYGSDFDATAKKKNFFSSKSLKEQRDQFEYATFNNETGSFAKNTFLVNEKGEKEKKCIDPTSLTIFENKFYVDYVKVKQKLGLTIPVCIASVACPFLIYIPFMNGNFKKGSGNLGVITPLEAKQGKGKETKTKSTKPKPTKK